ARRSPLAAGTSFLLLHLSGLCAGLVDGAHHVEGLLRQIVVLTLEDLLEAADRLTSGYVLSFAAREPLGDTERLREEALNLAGSRHRFLVVFRKLFHAED